WLLGISSTITLVVSPVAALADDTSAATPASSGAVAVNVADTVVVSQTSTHNGEGGADATVVEVFGETVVGGEQSGTGSASGDLISTGDTGAGSATVGGWSADVDGEGRSSAAASVAHVGLGGDGGGEVEVLGSRSSAEHDRSRASSYGVRAAGGGHELYLLRSDADTDGSATTALIDIDGNVIVPNDSVRQVCAALPAELLSVACVYAQVEQLDTNGDGVPDGAGATAGVVDGSLVGSIVLDLVQAEGVVASGSDDVAGAPRPPASGPVPVVGAPDGPGPLPRTGLGVLGLLVAGLTALGAGDALRRQGR
ncbi:MAG TPA: hypothetical protein VGA69_02240, partial [Nitriliruptorales bacterium]